MAHARVRAPRELWARSDPARIRGYFRSASRSSATLSKCRRFRVRSTAPCTSTIPAMRLSAIPMEAPERSSRLLTSAALSAASSPSSSAECRWHPERLHQPGGGRLHGHAVREWPRPAHAEPDHWNGGGDTGRDAHSRRGLPRPESRAVQHHHQDHSRNVERCRTGAVPGAAGAIDASRLTPHGDGPFAPVAANTTDEGRARNRRVELVAQP